MIRPAVLAGLSVLLAAWSAEGATVYRRAATRPSGATATLGGPAAKPAAVIGGPAGKSGAAIGGATETKAGPPGRGGARSHKSGPAAPASAGQGAPPVAAGQGAPPAAAPSAGGAPTRATSGPKGKSDGRAARR